MPIIPATPETGEGGSKVQGQPGEIVSNKNEKEKVWIVALWETACPAGIRPWD